MKKILLSMLMLLTISSCGKINDNKDDGKDYVIVRLGEAFTKEGRDYVRLRDSSDYKIDYKHNNSLDIKYYTKEECEKDVYDYVKHQKHDDNVIIGGKTYTYEFYPRIFNVYLCIKKDMWEQIKFSKFFVDLHKEVNDYIPGEEILYKDVDDFTEKMKSCGIVPFDFQHLPVPETPLICDKYSEENPIPTTSVRVLEE